MTTIRDDNTIYIRPARGFPDDGQTWEVLVKAKGEACIVCIGGEKEEALEAGGLLLWAIGKWGKDEYQNHGELDTHPERPETFDYPVVDEV